MVMIIKIINTLHVTVCFALLAALLLQLGACKKFVDAGAPQTELVAATVYATDQKATATVLGIYSSISGTNFSPGGNQSFSVVAGLSADELADYSFTSGRAEFYACSIAPTNTTNLAVWRSTYQYIYQANAVLEGLSQSTGVSAATKTTLRGEAKFLRAFLYFYLVNSWGDVPLITSTDYRGNSVATRTAQADVYKVIIADLTDAQNTLPDKDISGMRIRPTKWAAKALLARVYLYLHDWQNAESAATEVISNTQFALSANLSAVFLKDSRETIWQLMPVVPNHNSSEGFNYILTAKPNYIALLPSLVNSFEAGDTRRNKWVDSFKTGSLVYYYTSKYKIKTATSLSEYSVVLRLAELYLVRAEARAQQNKLLGANSAVDDLNVIRTRAGLAPTTATSQSQILDAVLQERKLELFTEWGHRWFDLKRTAKASIVLATLKGATWQQSDTLYPIPQMEIVNDNQLTQNPGY